MKISIHHIVTQKVGNSVGFSLPASFKVEVGTEYAIHQKADGKWETLPIVKVEDGKVTATFTSFSPVVVVKATDAASNGTEGATSPKTGAPASALPVLAMLCAAGVAVFGRKVKFN